MNTRRKGFLVLAGLLLIFTLPLLLARYVYQHPQLFKNQTNKGQLINPPLQLAQFPLYTECKDALFDKEALQGKWTLVYVTPVPCEAACLQQLYKIRQIRTALGKERGRVNRLLILTTSDLAIQYQPLQKQLATDYNGTLLAVTDPSSLSLFFKISLSQAAQLDKFYIIDPLGNIMLNYPADISSDAIFKDLKHLLKISQIG